MAIYSHSVMQPSSMEGYMQMLDRSEAVVAGWLRTKINEGPWEDKWWELKVTTMNRAVRFVQS